MGKPARCKGKFITKEQFHQKVIFYKDKPDLSFVMPDYYRVDLDDDTTLSFVSPDGYYMLKRNKDDDRFYTTSLGYEETLSMLKTYLRKDKLKWISVKNKLKSKNEKK